MSNFFRNIFRKTFLKKDFLEAIEKCKTMLKINQNKLRMKQPGSTKMIGISKRINKITQ